MEKRDGSVNEERVFDFGEEKANEGIRCLIEEGTSNEVEKLRAVSDKYLERNRGKPE